MKKFKLISLLILLVLFTGCTPEYNITIENSKITEELIITEDYNNIAQSFSSLYAIEDDEKKYDFKSSGNYSTFKYTYNFSNFDYSNLIKSCYDAYNFFKEDDHYVLQTGSQFICYPLQIKDYQYVNYDSLHINIKVVGYEVLEHNADSINNNVYSWNINKDNYNNKPIIMKIKGDFNNKKKQNNNYFNQPLFIILGVLLIIGTIVIIFVLNLNKNRNKL